MAGTNNSWNNQIAGSYNQIILNAGTNGVAISTDASAATVNVATGAAVKTATLGSTNSTSATTVQSGSGALALTSTNGTWTGNSGTGALGISTDASATTVSFATGAAVKTVTLGSTNSTSSTAIKSGTGNVTINSGLTIDSTGRNYNTVQPAFSVQNNAGASNVTGDNTNYTMVWDNEIFDQGGNFASNTFTAPITGRYAMGFGLQTNGVTTQTLLYLTIVTTARTWQSVFINPTAVSFGASFEPEITIFADMTAGDTATAHYIAGNATKTMGFGGNTGAGANVTHFWGYLVC